MMLKQLSRLFKNKEENNEENKEENKATMKAYVIVGISSPLQAHLEHIWIHLKVPAICKLAQVSKAMHQQIVENDSFWHALRIRDYPECGMKLPKNYSLYDRYKDLYQVPQDKGVGVRFSVDVTEGPIKIDLTPWGDYGPEYWKQSEVSALLTLKISFVNFTDQQVVLSCFEEYCAGSYCRIESGISISSLSYWGGMPQFFGTRTPYIMGPHATSEEIKVKAYIATGSNAPDNPMSEWLIIGEYRTKIQRKDTESFLLLSLQGELSDKKENMLRNNVKWTVYSKKIKL